MGLNPILANISHPRYVMCTDDVMEDDIRRCCEDVLPPYMVPSSFLRVDEWPRTASAKIDRLALRDPTSISTRRLPRTSAAPAGTWLPPLL